MLGLVGGGWWRCGGASRESHFENPPTCSQSLSISLPPLEVVVGVHLMSVSSYEQFFLLLIMCMLCPPVFAIPSPMCPFPSCFPSQYQFDHG